MIDLNLSNFVQNWSVFGTQCIRLSIYSKFCAKLQFS